MLAKAQVIGNLGRDPETRYLPSGQMVVSFSVASTRKYTDRGGQQVEKTTWFNVSAWSKLAETLDRLTQDGYLAKGRQVYVSGRIELREYQGNDGTNRTSLDLNADEVLMVGSRQESGSVGGGGGGGRSQQAPDDAGDLGDVPF
jgi:single-strand DNA-binding protein